VIVAALAVGTAPAWNAGFERDAVPRFVISNVLADFDDLTGALVPEDERVFHDVVPDTTVFVVVDVGATDTHVSHGYKYLVGAGRRSGTVLQLELSWFYQYSSSHTWWHGTEP
jgi:hypothetical protein